MRQGCSGNRSRGGQARKPAKNEASRIEGCEIRDLSRVEMRLASAPLAVKSRFSRGFRISTLIRYHYPGRERLREIELFFRVLKQGCQIERLRLETDHRLLNAIAIYLIIAWRI